MEKIKNESQLEKLFNQFLNESIKDDKDIEYCLLQSTVEPTIRFKFGSWLNKHCSDRLTLNLMEANRLDLTVGIDDEIYFVEFGHLLNLLLHGADSNKGKVDSDSEKIDIKAQKLIGKIKSIEKGKYNTFFNDKKINYLICSLFSDIKVKMEIQQIVTQINISRLKSGTLFKYGQSFSFENNQDYFQKYLTYIKNEFDKSETKYLTGYNEVVVIPEELSLHYRFDEINK
jgi:hypothetical protein